MIPTANISRRTMELVKGRISIPRARYFATLCATRASGDLTRPVLGSQLIRTISNVFAPPDALLLCATVMPNHLQLLFELGTRLPLNRLLAKFKTLTRKTCANELAWQRNFYEHRLRPDDSVGEIAHYIFLNPYPKRLIQRTQTWPYWLQYPAADFDFLQLLEAGRFPPAPWLADDSRPVFLRQRPANAVRASSAPINPKPPP